MTGFISVFITTGSSEEAEKIAHVIVEEGYAACANILLGVQSFFRWQDNIEQANECVIIAKTKAEKFGELQKRVKELHSYDCPCIVAWPIVAGSEEYLNWIKNET